MNNQQIFPKALLLCKKKNQARYGKGVNIQKNNLVYKQKKRDFKNTFRQRSKWENKITCKKSKCIIIPRKLCTACNRNSSESSSMKRVKDTNSITTVTYTESTLTKNVHIHQLHEQQLIPQPAIQWFPPTSALTPMTGAVLRVWECVEPHVQSPMCLCCYVLNHALEIYLSLFVVRQP